MDLLPAIDLRDGQCVRLLQGDYDRQIDYNPDPADQARRFETQGARWLHVVDLDGARLGTQHNLPAIERIRRTTRLNIEVGGGIRSEHSIKLLLDVGIARVVLGTKALEDPSWFRTMVFRYPHRLVLGLDARDGRLATRGWTESTTSTAVTLAQQVNNYPLAALVYTDIARDGMLTGPNVPAIRALAEASHVPVIASGGVATLDDIKQLLRLPLAGIITGRALYEGTLKLPDALALLDRSCP